MITGNRSITKWSIGSSRYPLSDLKTGEKARVDSDSDSDLDYVACSDIHDPNDARRKSVLKIQYLPVLFCSIELNTLLLLQFVGLSLPRCGPIDRPIDRPTYPYFYQEFSTHFHWWSRSSLHVSFSWVPNEALSSHARLCNNSSVKIGSSRLFF